MELNHLPFPVIQQIFSYLNCEDISTIGNLYVNFLELAIFFVRKQLHLVNLKVTHLLKNDYFKQLTHSTNKIDCLQFFNKLLSLQTYTEYALAFSDYGIQNEEVSLQLGRLTDVLCEVITYD